ncbi:MAG: 3-deoxy-D-manno-octulosonic acid transferase [Proteobacteria bacterium]|nr:3-deoxy-D-manno-octulosonic acid transferase [Pseudomonadota bacterium]MBU2228329.1 3-deoxy-D-manno-octulosonic acid transferase [Pseudomonadota bacterium]MBU2262324.1 3-deoxy-D-manno-octulosonic acid transferase [Pseudomonadota bacterium]
MFWSGLYNALLIAAAAAAVPYYGARMLLTGKYRKSLGPKFGRLDPETVARMEGSPRIWVHAVSVGEATAAAAIVAALRSRLPGACIVLSTSTETGQEMARNLVADATALIYYPLDIPCVVRSVLDLVRPDCFVPVETELWPNFIRICRARGTRIVMANGRISSRSYRGYRATRFFWKEILAALDAAGVISRADADRLAVIGMPAGRIQVLGNAKYDGLAARVSPELEGEIAGRLGIAPGEGVLVAGSTHEGEEAVILDVYRRLLEIRPDFKLILVPRHIERGEAVAELIRRAGFADCIRMSEIMGGRLRTNERVVLVDVIGELFKVYSLATVVFCGGSLVPKGGQNILEAAAWGKVVFHGPHMDDFREERALIDDAGAGIAVANGDELYEGIRELLDRPDLLRQKGEAGRQAVAANKGAAARYADLITDVFRPPPVSETRSTSDRRTAGAVPVAPCSSS